MRRRYRLRSHDREHERYLDAIDEARGNVRLARRDYHQALDEPAELEEADPRDDHRLRRRREPR